MSDISIPGVNDKYGTKQLIEDLMKVERIPKTRAEAELKTIEKQRSIWQDIGVKMSRLRDSSKALYSFNNPFTARVAKSSNEDALTATANRDAPEGVKSIEIKQIAQADRFITSNLPKDYKVPAGTYQFSLGDKSVSIQFAGGSISNLSEIINKRGKDVIKAQVVTLEKSSQALLIEAQKTGQANRLGFSGASLDFALASGMVEKSSSSERAYPLTPGSLRAWTKPINPALVSIKDGVLSIKAGGETAVVLSPPAKVAGGAMVEFEMKVSSRPDGAVAAVPPSGPTIPQTGSIQYQGIGITSESSTVPLPAWNPPPEPQRVDDLGIAFAGLTTGSVASLGQAQESGDFAKVSVRLSDLGGDVGQLNFRNLNTRRDVEIRSIRVYDPDETGGLKPKNPVSVAQDAILKMDGIEVKREDNSVDDLIPGVTLSLHDRTDKSVRLSVEPDQKGVKDSLISWVGYYNQLMTEVNILSQTNDQIISELDYLTDDERKSATGRLGLLQGDFTLNQVKNSLQRITASPYLTRDGNKLSLLTQIGISTNASSSGSTSGNNQAKLRGYLEVDESKLEENLKSHMAAVKDLFGNDTDNDLITDAGLGYSLDNLVKPYVETAGLLAQKQQTLTTKSDSQKKTIANLDAKLVTKEQELKEKYGSMQSSLNELERTSSSISNFSNQSSSN